MSSFRFESLEIWKLAVSISDKLFDVADSLREMKRYKFADQLDSAVLSISNNIAEGSGSFSDKDFANFLNISRRSLFECANIIAILQMRNIISNEEKEQFFTELDKFSRMITNFRKTLLKGK